MKSAQAGILDPVPPQGRYLFFDLADADGSAAALQRLAALADGQSVVVGLGPASVAALGASVPGLRDMPDLSRGAIHLPVTPVALWCWLRGDDHGDLVILTLEIERAVAPAFRLARAIEAFRHGRGPNGHGRDLTGYEDGTENPQGDAAVAAALDASGASFVAVQQWQHDFDAFEAMDETQRDAMVGRRRSDNEELDEAPPSAHVKRTAQEDFTPAAFVLRRSMPWALNQRAGLMFVAFGCSFDAFEAQMRRMAGHDDGIADALFQVSRPLGGAYLWCPPVRHGRLDLRALGLAA